MNNYLNIMPIEASFDLKCSNIHWRLELRPIPHWGVYDAPQTP